MATKPGKITEYDRLSKETHENASQDQAKVVKEGGSIIHKSGDRIVHLLGQDHIIKGGHLECQKCKMTAGRIEAFSTLCRQGTCKGAEKGNASRPSHLPGEDSQKQ